MKDIVIASSGVQFRIITALNLIVLCLCEGNLLLLSYQGTKATEE